MSVSTKFGFQNSTDSTKKTTLKALGMVSNYAVSEDASNVVVLNNKTAPIDKQELVTFRTRSIPKINTALNVRYPARVQKGIQFTTRVEAVLTTEDPTINGSRTDEPMAISISASFPNSGNITSAHIEELMIRAISTLYKDNGTSRIDDLMRSGERPIAD